MGFKKDVRSSLENIRVELTVMNKELKDHTRRSTNLEERVLPLEASHIFFNKLSKSLMAGVAMIAGLVTAYHYLFTK